MRLTNRSHYETRALRRIITTVHRILARTEGRLPSWRNLRVLVETRRSRVYDGGVSGWATLDGWQIVLRLPHPNRHVVSARKFAWLVEHELYHSYGHRHGKFTESPPEWWADKVGMADLPVKTARPRPRRDVVALRAERARRGLATWKRRLKMAQGKVKMYERRVRYYARKSPTGTASEPSLT